MNKLKFLENNSQDPGSPHLLETLHRPHSRQTDQRPHDSTTEEALSFPSTSRSIDSSFPAKKHGRPRIVRLCSLHPPASHILLLSSRGEEEDMTHTHVLSRRGGGYERPEDGGCRGRRGEEEEDMRGRRLEAAEADEERRRRI
ncbi:hypothetical protein NHX12_014377 [Muraenolepis orangiensis]|uniref:Uncharacterized protein n=1 Tax=Muraenolepis orangiensis TaxID=630683 RepID=A0A9Q0I5K4_9TELE|nr:hypothetical protein NHX12_014377 [Muraenolepis orangiensis]